MPQKSYAQITAAVLAFSFSVAVLMPLTAAAQSRLPKAVALKIIHERLKIVEGVVETLDEKLEKLLNCVSIFEGELGGLPGPHVIFSRCNVHVRSGLGATDGLEQDDPAPRATNALGNLIIGYNEGSCLSDPDGAGLDDNPSMFRKPCLIDEECGAGGTCEFGKREGSHNLVVGHQHEYPSFGGILGGRANAANARHTSATGGFSNDVNGPFAAVHGGSANVAVSEASTIAGGLRNTTRPGSDNTGSHAAVLGGSRNTASGDYSAVVSGSSNTASGNYAAVVSGGLNEAIGFNSAVVGGGGLILGKGTTGYNRAFGNYSAILGGQLNLTGSTKPALVDGYAAAVCGGTNNNAFGITATIGGGFANVAGGYAAGVSGGDNRSAPGAYNWAAGGLFQSN